MAVTVDQYTTAAVFAGTFALVYLVVNRVLGRRQSGNLKLPPSVGSLPLVGSVPFLPGLPEMHMFFAEKSKELGDVVSFRVSSSYLSVVLNTHEAIREAFVKRSIDFANRPTFYIKRFFNPNAKGVIGHRYNADFKKYHQLSLTILKEFGFGKNIMEERINAEVLQLIKIFKEERGQPIEPKECITTAVSNIISNIIFGHGINQDEDLKKATFEMVENLIEGGFTLLILDILPALRFVPYFRKLIDEGMRISENFFLQVEKKIQENLTTPTVDNFVLSYTQYEREGLDREQLHHTVRDLILAGTETSATTVRWTLALLADYPDVQRRLLEEIDSVVPRDRLPSLEDKQKLPYVEAAIMEIMRFKTLVPWEFRTPLCAIQKSAATSFPAAHWPLFVPCIHLPMPIFIITTSMIFFNLYAAHMDPNVWDKPHEFRPERFLDDGGNVVNKDLMIAFSLGKRSCLGELLARQEVYLFITGLVQQFDIRPPEGVDRIDPKDHVRSTLAPSPFRVRLIARDDPDA